MSGQETLRVSFTVDATTLAGLREAAQAEADRFVGDGSHPIVQMTKDPWQVGVERGMYRAFFEMLLPAEEVSR